MREAPNGTHRRMRYHRAVRIAPDGAALRIPDVLRDRLRALRAEGRVAVDTAHELLDRLHGGRAAPLVLGDAPLDRPLLLGDGVEQLVEPRGALGDHAFELRPGAVGGRPEGPGLSGERGRGDLLEDACRVELVVEAI